MMSILFVGTSIILHYLALLVLKQGKALTNSLFRWTAAGFIWMIAQVLLINEFGVLAGLIISLSLLSLIGMLLTFVTES